MTFELKTYTQFWGIRVMNSAGEVVQVWTGSRKDTSRMKQCLNKAKAICKT